MKGRVTQGLWVLGKTHTFRQFSVAVDPRSDGGLDNTRTVFVCKYRGDRGGHKAEKCTVCFLVIKPHCAAKHHSKAPANPEL